MNTLPDRPRRVEHPTTPPPEHSARPADRRSDALEQALRLLAEAHRLVARYAGERGVSHE